MGNTIRIQEHLPESEYKKASVHLANALSTNHFKSFEELIDDDAVLVLHESRSIFGKENIIEYWKDWLSRLKKENLSVEYEVKLCANILRAALNIKISGYQQMYVLFRIHNGNIVNMVLAGNPLQNPMIRYEDLDKLPYTAEYIKANSNGRETPVTNRMPCLSCGNPSEMLDWYKVQINKGQLGYIGQASICPKCNRVVEFYPEQLIRYEHPVKDNYTNERESCNLYSMSLKGITLFYNDTPLKNTKYVNSLPEDLKIKMDFTFGLSDPEFGPASIKEIAEDSNWMLLSKIQSENHELYEQIKNCYTVALEDGIIEAANNLGILAYNYEEKPEKGIILFKKGIDGKSTNAMINLFTVLWGESRFAEATNALLEFSESERPSLKCLYNLALLYLYGDDYKNNPLKRDIEVSKYYLNKIIEFENCNDYLEEAKVIQEAKVLLSEIDSFNPFSQKGKELYDNCLKSVVSTTDIKNKGEIFNTLTSIKPQKGWKLGLKLAEGEGTGDISNFYLYNDENMVEKDLLKHIEITKSEMSIWELYLLLKSPCVMPTYWHGGYIRRKYIFSKSDVESIEALRGKDISMLFSDKKLLPCITIENKELDTVDFVEKEYHADIYCCYWSEWEGLVREHTCVTISNNKVVSFENTDSFTFHKYDCGILF